MVEQIKPIDKHSGAANTAVAEQPVFAQQQVARPKVERRQEVSSAREEVPREEVEKATEKLNRLLGFIDKRFKFSVHEETHRIMVTVIDRETGEVLNEVPSKKVLDLLASFRELVGFAVDEKV